MLPFGGGGSQTSTHTGLAYMSNGSVSKWKQATAIGNFINITHFDAHKLSGLNKRKNIPMRICYNSVRTKVFAFIVEYRHSSTLPQVQLVPKTESTLSTLETVERSAPDDLRDPMSKSEMY